MTKPRMTLQSACAFLAWVHTEDDEIAQLFGPDAFTVEHLPRLSEHERERYFQAWSVVRRFVRGEPVGLNLGSHIDIKE